MDNDIFVCQEQQLPSPGALLSPLPQHKAFDKAADLVFWPQSQVDR